MGKYAERNLYENEWIVENVPRDIWGLVGWWCLTILTLIVDAALTVLFIMLDKNGTLGFMPIGLIVVILFTVLFLVVFIKTICGVIIFTHTEYVLTNRRMIGKKGVFHIKSKDIPLLEIQGVYVDIGFWGRVFNVGTLVIKHSKGKPIVLKIQDADDFKTTIIGQIDQFERDRLADQSVWTAQALLRGTRGVNPYGQYMQQPKKQPQYQPQSQPQAQPQPKPAQPQKLDPYGGYGYDPFEEAAARRANK